MPPRNKSLIDKRDQSANIKVFENGCDNSGLDEEEALKTR